MARFLIRSAISAFITMLLVSIILFVLLESRTENVAIRILGVFATEEQLASYQSQLGLNASLAQRYLDWLAGNDWRAERLVGEDLVAVNNTINPREYLGRFYVDSLVHDPAVLSYMIELMGERSIAMGSDYHHHGGCCGVATGRGRRRGNLLGGGHQ